MPIKNEWNHQNKNKVTVIQYNLTISEPLISNLWKKSVDKGEFMCNLRPCLSTRHFGIDQGV